MEIVGHSIDICGANSKSVKFVGNVQKENLNYDNAYKWTQQSQPNYSLGNNQAQTQQFLQQQNIQNSTQASNIEETLKNLSRSRINGCRDKELTTFSE